jgi:hypothetical protein
LTDVSKPLKPEERREKNVLENIDINNYASEFTPVHLTIQP